MTGIDVSKHQGTIDWNKVKASGVDFVIIRAGYGKALSQKDPQFEANYKGAKAAGLKIGAYWYSYAVTPDEAELEAKVFCEAVRGKQFDLPLYYDLEENKGYTQLPKADSLINAFCSYIEKQGYFAGFYMSESHVKTYVSNETRNRFTLWNACWKSAQGLAAPLWQNSETGRVNGISGNVDTDILDNAFAETVANFYASKTAAATPETKPEATPKKAITVTVDGVTVFSGLI